MATETVNIDASALRLPAQAGQNGKFLTTDGTNPSWANTSGSGDVSGPASATDGAVALYDGTTGKLLKNGPVLGTAAQANTGDFDAAGAAATAQSNAATDATTKANAAQAAAIAASDPVGSAATVQTNLNTHTSNTSNPHGVTKTQVGLGNVDDTSDANKPVSTAQQTELDLKANKGANSDITSASGFTGDLGTPQHIKLALSPTGTPAEGWIYWDPTSQALAVKNNEADVEMTVGQETWIRVRNVSGSTIANGKPVYITGSNSGLPTIGLAKADASTTALCRGIATHDIENNTNGYITSVGVVNAVDTSAFAAGDNLWVSPTTAGALVNTAPSHPNYISRVGVVGVSNASTGTIVVVPSGTFQANDPSSTTFSGTDTWTAGAAPSGASSKSQYFTQVGKMVTWQISIAYATTGTTVTGLSVTLPTQFPTPAIPTGFTGASTYLWNCDNGRFLSTPSGTQTTAASCCIRRNAADTGFEITMTVTSGSYRCVLLSGHYFTT